MHFECTAAKGQIFVGYALDFSDKTETTLKALL